ncbi:MAG: prepilin-type N-terminal cleavage/methylation domain-containing protein, partial [Pirellulaceae bacterium]
MSRSHQHHKTAFTLIELLVVISIIGILIGLLIPTIRGVMMRAEVTRIVMEIKQLESGLEAYKKQFDDYPPDFTDPRVVVRHARKAFPRISDNEINKLLLKVYGVNLQDLVSSGPTVWNIDPAEALVFWLSGFSEDVTQPFFGSGGPFSAGTRNKGVYDFDSTRLFVGDDGDLYPVYLPRTFELPYVFFDARTYRYKAPWDLGNEQYHPQYPPEQIKGPTGYHLGIT